VHFPGQRLAEHVLTAKVLLLVCLGTGTLVQRAGVLARAA
jgi:hypothetical protein